ncbi:MULTISPECIES: DUF1444 domain-containing protein [Priestia]|uniref:DUF1444 domain-containing protein n=1 Tax=Priestia TaxID=2800373 RepID=UPI000BF2D8DF|nr:DUF1444 domain-containing protein [Priestia aryabhattai]MBK0007599.1 DUF1444 domain-containing protein [Bacillus sp. S35]MCM3642366.1 DUF1444 domain-containing protein [Priestia aryabhattai]PFW72260.1 DUF1444 domain-containing protein [Priestia aryabhattai]
MAKMNSQKMRKLLEERLMGADWSFSFDREKDTLRVEHQETKKGVNISLPGLIAKWEEKKEAALDEMVYYIKEALRVMNDEQQVAGKEKRIYPVIRSTSFPDKSNEDVPLIYDEHTAETRIYYALDLGNTYRLLDEKLIRKENLDLSAVREMAKFNLRSLPISHKKDTVAGNDFYFVNQNDGYDASRILNEAFLQDFASSVSGTMAIAVPHQDVLILADIQNETGYDILAQMTMSFFASGRVPITALSFLYENGELEPIFILGKNRSKGRD